MRRYSLLAGIGLAVVWLGRKLAKRRQDDNSDPYATLHEYC